MIDLFLIALMIVYFTDVSGFPTEMLKVIWNYAYKDKPMPYDLTWSKIHPLLKVVECSLCQVWWVTLIVTICCGWWSVGMMAYCALLSFLTPIFKDLLLVARDFLVEMINAIVDYFCL